MKTEVVKLILGIVLFTEHNAGLTLFQLQFMFEKSDAHIYSPQRSRKLKNIEVLSLRNHQNLVFGDQILPGQIRRYEFPLEILISEPSSHFWVIPKSRHHSREPQRSTKLKNIEFLYVEINKI